MRMVMLVLAFTLMLIPAVLFNFPSLQSMGFQIPGLLLTGVGMLLAMFRS